MTVDNSSHQTSRAARRLIRTARKGALATLDHRDPSRPYVSLVLVATEPDGTPITLLSGLALHTRNLERDARAGLLIDGTEDLDDPLTGPRLTLVGQMAPTASATAIRRFLARHPSAEAYAGFPDFRPFALEVAAAHYIGGFGRIVDLSPEALATEIRGADDLVDAEGELILQLNEQLANEMGVHAGAAQDAGSVRISGLDPDGADLLHRNKALRVEFSHRVANRAEVFDALRSALRASL